MLDDSAQSLLRILKWLCLATVIGLVVGVCDAVFLKLLDVAIGARNTLPGCPVCGGAFFAQNRQNA